MAAWVCLACSTVYSVEAPCCPHCGSTRWAEDGSEEAEMAKISKSGVSDATNVDLPEQDRPGVDVVGVPVGQDRHNPDTADPTATDQAGQDAADPLVDRDEYDPGEYTVAEVNAYLDECREEGNLEEAARVQEAERAGKNRSGIMSRA